MKRNIAYILGVMLLAVSCISEQGLDVNSTRKDEVNFVADMKNAVTRTLYGADNATTIKVKWVNGDQIKVFGTNCADSRKEGEYQITEAANQPNVDGSVEESRADALVRMSEVGVQWGSEKTSDFVAVYPAENASFQYNSTSGVVTATTTISSTQNYVFNDAVVTKKDKNGNDIKVWEGTHFANDATNPSMQNAIMYARTDDVSAGSNVSLLFEPYSTVLKFRFEGFESLWSPDAEAYVQSIVITAPQGDYIAGDFDITIPRNKDVSSTNPVKATSKGTGSNSITINTIKAGGSFLKVKANEAVEFNVFTVPLSGLTMLETNPWTVTINVQGMDPLVYKMLPTKDGGYTLVPGLIHKVKVPKMVSNKVPEWNPENWITQIPPPVYISELSVPGAWYCMNSNYQTNVNLSEQYAAGIRAFNIDCRMTCADVKSIATFFEPDLSDLALVVADTDDVNSTGSSVTQGTKVLSALGEIAKLVKDDEYIVVVLTIAEKPMTRTIQMPSWLGGATYQWVYGNVNPEQILSELAKIINNETNQKNLKLYTKEITPDTIVDEVLGHMIIKVNVNSQYSIYSKYSSLPGTLISEASMAPADDSSAGIHAGNYVEMVEVPMYWGTSFNASKSMTYCYHQAQRTIEDGTTSVAGVPSYGDRKQAINSIIEKSKDVYDDAEHNVWFQMGIGGFRKNNNQDDDASSRLEVAQMMNPYVYAKITEKMNSNPSPVGIVLMNYCTETTKWNAIDENGVAYKDANDNQYTASSQDLVKAIIEMNGKFYLNRRGNDVITGDGTQTQELDTKAAAYVGPDAF